MTYKSGELFLTLNKAVEVAVNQFGVDPVFARQEFEQKCYIPCPDYEKGFYDGLAEGRDLIEYAMEVCKGEAIIDAAIEAWEGGTENE